MESVLISKEDVIEGLKKDLINELQAELETVGVSVKVELIDLKWGKEGITLYFTQEDTNQVPSTQTKLKNSS